MCGNRDTTGSAVLWPCLARLFLFMTTPHLISDHYIGSGRALALEQVLPCSRASETNVCISVREETRWRICAAFEPEQEIPLGFAGYCSIPVAEQRSIW